MTDLLDKLERLRAPALLVGADDVIIFATASAQDILLDVDVTDMPAASFLCDWDRCRELLANPETKTVEVFLRSGQYRSMSAAVFNTKFRRRPVSGVVRFPDSQNASMRLSASSTSVAATSSGVQPASTPAKATAATTSSMAF